MCPLIPPLCSPSPWSDTQRLDFSGIEPDVKPFEERFGRRIMVSCHDLTFSLQGCVNERSDGILTNVCHQLCFFPCYFKRPLHFSSWTCTTSHLKQFPSKKKEFPLNPLINLAFATCRLSTQPSSLTPLQVELYVLTLHCCPRKYTFIIHDGWKASGRSCAGQLNN